MTQKELIDQFKIDCNFVESDGYLLSVHEREIFFSKHTDSEGFYIGFLVTEYDNVRVSGLKVMKRFNAVEKLLINSLKGTLEEYYTIYELANPTQIPQGLNYEETNNNVHFELHDISDYEKFVEYFRKFHKNQANNFLKKYSQIEELNNILSELLESRKIQSMFTDSGGNASIFRFFAIALLCKNEKIETFLTKTYIPYLISEKNNINKRELEIIEHIKSSVS